MVCHLDVMLLAMFLAAAKIIHHYSKDLSSYYLFNGGRTNWSLNVPQQPVQNQKLL